MQQGRRLSKQLSSDREKSLFPNMPFPWLLQKNFSLGSEWLLQTNSHERDVPKMSECHFGPPMAVIAGPLQVRCLHDVLLNAGCTRRHHPTLHRFFDRLAVQSMTAEAGDAPAFADAALPINAQHCLGDQAGISATSRAASKRLASESKAYTSGSEPKLLLAKRYKLNSIY